MQETISLLQSFEVWIYALLGLFGLYFGRKFFVAWQELRNAGFGLERDNAQARLNQSAFLLVLLLLLAVGEFTLVSFIAPSLSASLVEPTATLSFLSTATPTPALGLVSQGTGGAPTAQFATPGPTEASGCIAGRIEITSPADGQQISGVVPVIGTANIENFGFYKIELKSVNSPDWVTLQAGNAVVSQSKLGDWDTRNLSPGEYQLGLVLVDNQARLAPACIVQVNVILSADGTSAP